MKGKRFVFAIALAAALLWSPGARLAAQGQKGANAGGGGAAEPLLPASAGNWSSSAAPTQVSAQQIEQVAADRANILREYGITSGERREYTNGRDQASVTLYRMVDPSAAFGAFTFFRDPDMALPGPVTAASYAAGKRGRELLVVGDLVLEVTAAKGEMSSADLNALARSVSGKADQRPYPPIATFLPHEGLIPGSEKYVLGPLALAKVFPGAPANNGDWAGFASGAEAMAGRYRLPEAAGARSSLKGRPEGVLLLIMYPTQQLAADHYEALSKAFALNADAAEGGRPGVFGNRSSALIALLADAPSRETAANLLNQIHYSSQVTWNEPTHNITDPTISTIVVGAIVDTGAIMLLAVAASLGFGGFRILAKFLAPGRIFDRNTDVEILQLGINSKPIDVKDFYILNSPR